MKKEIFIFTVSVVILAVLYGVFAERNDVFPSKWVDDAMQAGRIVGALYGGKPTSIGTKVRDFTGTRAHMPMRVASGTTLLTSEWKKDGTYQPALKLINRNGEVLHTWWIDGERVFPDVLSRRLPENADIHGSYLEEDGSIVVNLEYLGVVKINTCGETLWRLPEKNHHSIEPAEDGGYWIPSTSDAPIQSTREYPDGFPGLDGKSVWVDSIQKVSSEGEVMTEINILDLLYKNDLQRFLVKSTSARNALSYLLQDVTHLNDVDPLRSDMADEYSLFGAGDLVVSLRNPNLVFVLNPESQNIKWHASEPFIGQHDPDFVGNGWIGVFDNNRDFTERGSMSGGSRIVYIKPETGEKKVVLSSENTNHFYTDIRGKWQKLENGNLLVTEAQAGRAFEATPDGEIVWEWAHERIGDTQEVPSLAQAKRYNIDEQDVADWRCSNIPK